MSEPAIALENLTLGYNRHPAVHHLSVRIDRGALVAVTGPNGAGKSTLMKGIVGQLRPLDGRIDLHGISRRDIAYLPQQAEIDRSFPITVFDLVATGLWRRTGAFGGLDGESDRRIRDALTTVGLAEFEGRAIGSLSGGQFQRMLFARVLLQDASLILLDEPFNSVDTSTVRDLLAIIDRWHGEGRTIMTVLHDIDQVRGRFPETLLLSRRLVCFGSTEEVLTAGNLRRAHQLTEAFDENAAICAQD
jgi:zinc/manganese transport system ATP-binding protein